MIEEAKNIERVVIKKRAKKWGKTGNRVRGQSMEANRNGGSGVGIGSESLGGKKSNEYE